MPELSSSIHRSRQAFTLLELLVVIGVVAILSGIIVPVARQAIHSSTLATSSSNLRQLSAGMAAYLSSNSQTFWRYRENINESDRRGVKWWFGYEDITSMRMPEGERFFDGEQGPLGGYVPGGVQPDPSFGFSGDPFKPKYHIGYIGIGYNVLLGGGWGGTQPRVRFSELSNPSRVVVFATSAQVNTFQHPASASRPMIEEFYGIDDINRTIHFRHRGEALVAFADASIGFLSIDESTRDQRAPGANVGRFAPVGSDQYLR